jgi:hypothetical protein
MFSTDNFYHILYSNLIKPCKSISAVAYKPIDENQELHPLYCSTNLSSGHNQHVITWYDQEPLLDIAMTALVTHVEYVTENTETLCWDTYNHNLKNQYKHIVANSEVSETKNKFMSEFDFLDWYYFSHGFLALDWYRDVQYLPIDKTASFDKVFIMFNHLTTKYRSYRLGLVADIMSRGLEEHGLISLPLLDRYHNGNYMNEILDKNSLLGLEHKKLILKTIRNLDRPLTIDNNNVDGTFSAKINLDANRRGLWHLVTETNFYLPKLHLTEKIFKPIVSFRPFILACAAGNLQYLRSYGFKTFGDFIDESYDLEQDNEKRMFMIVDEIEKLCKLSIEDQRNMFEAMKPILEHNFNHFYGDFKKVIVDEMIYGFGECIDGLIDDSAVDYAAVSRLLLK